MGTLYQGDNLLINKRMQIVYFLSPDILKKLNKDNTWF